jgi:IS5 family transposase
MEASMKQQTLAGFEKYAKTTRRAQFLAEMDRIVPWPELEAVVEPVYPKVSEAGGRPPIPLERMLRIYFLQLWFNLSDPAVEEALYDSESMRRFAGIDLGQESAPDETTVCKFRHLLERNKLGKKLLSTVNEYLALNGIKISKGTIVDATIIGAPSSTAYSGDRDRSFRFHVTGCWRGAEPCVDDNSVGHDISDDVVERAAVLRSDSPFSVSRWA